ncbi:hypothetical protein LTR50_001514 [Elasticomyces elasticus]|nr:hypothetical protein LTR50_001514 [Elasticomyces elasticus]
MDSLNVEDKILRLSESPGRSPRIAQGLTSPVRSIRPEMVMNPFMESIHQQDLGLRTTGFFDDTSDEDAADPAESHKMESDVDILPGRRTFAGKQRKSETYLGSRPGQFVSQCEEKHASTPSDIAAYLRLTPATPLEPRSTHAGSSGTSFDGSVDELPAAAVRPRRNVLPQDRHGQVRERSPRSSTAMERDERLAVAPTPSKAEQILGAHAITLQALLRDEEALQNTTNSLTPPRMAERTSRFSVEPTNHRIRSTSAPQAKKVSLAPPPIDTTKQRQFPENFVRTPYPFPAENRQSLRKPSPLATNSVDIPPLDFVLTLSIRRANRNSRPRIAKMMIPTDSYFVAVKNTTNGEREKHFNGLDFDDAQFFRQLRTRYRDLTGPYRFLSARSLSSIAINSSKPDIMSGAHRLSLSPGVGDSYSEDKLLQNYLDPSKSKARYAWVHWAHRLAATPRTPKPASTSDSDAYPDTARSSNPSAPDGLEFVVSWSFRRILSAFALVIAASLAAMLLWILLGKSSTPGGGGFRAAGDRVVAGVLMGICTLLLGLSGIAGWIGISWLVM